MAGVPPTVIARCVITAAAAIFATGLWGADATLTRRYYEAIDLMETKGDCPAAVRIFEEVAKGNDRNLAARSLLHIGYCTGILGEPGAPDIYQRIVRDFKDQDNVVAEARVRLSAMTGRRKEEAKPAEPKPPVAPRVVAMIPVGAHAHRAAITPNGAEVYVSNLEDDSVSVIDTATNTVTHTLRVGRQPNPIVVTPDGLKVYVGQHGGDISVIDTAAKTVTSIDLSGVRVDDLAVTPDGGALYAAVDDSRVTRIDTATHAIGTVSSVTCPKGLAVTPDGRVLYVSYQCGGPGGRKGHDAIAKFDARTGDFLGAIQGFPHVGGVITISPDGRQVWANGNNACLPELYDAEGCPSVPSHVVNVIDHEAGTLLKTIALGWFNPVLITIFPDSQVAAVGSTDNLVFFDTTTFEVIGSIPVRPSGSLAFSPDGASAYAPVPQESAVAVLEMFTPVDIDILPGGDPNIVRLGSGGTIPVAILARPFLDVAKLDPLTITLAGARVRLSQSGLPMASLEDRDSNGAFHRLVVHIDADKLQLRPGDTQAVLKGRTRGGMWIRGVDKVRVVP